LNRRFFAPISFLLLTLAFTGCPGNNNQNQGSQTNTPPFIKSADILPPNPVQGSRLDLRIMAGDKEGDQITYTVRWFLNGKEIGEGVEYYINEAKRGDQIFAEVTPSDGKASGAAVRTAIATIGNTSPKIVGGHISPDTVLTSTGTLTVSGDGIDPDGDSIRWTCRWKLNGKALPDTGLTINLTDLKLKKGSNLVAELYAHDSETVSLPYQLEISVVNGHPILQANVDSVPYQPGSVNFPVPIIDPDNDPMTFELLQAPRGLTINRTTGVVTGVAADSGSFEILVRATDSEGAYLDARFTLNPPK
jgi:hypothetical protein